MPLRLLKDKMVVTSGGENGCTGKPEEHSGELVMLFLGWGTGYDGDVQFVKIHPATHF